MNDRGLPFGRAAVLIAIVAALLAGQTSPHQAVAQTDPARLASDNTAFAFDLYHALAADPEAGNLIYSPYSVSLALAMTYGGARGETARQMAETLHFTLPGDELHPAFHALQEALARPAEVPGEQPLELNIANAIWGQAGFPFRAAYLDLLAAFYEAGLRELDFLAAPEDARQTINDWVSQETEDRITDLLPPGSIQSDTRLVLTNAIYFYGAWRSAFEEALTAEGVFHLLDGGEVAVPMMRQTEHFGYAAGEGYQAVQLPYQGGRAAMLILLPDEGRFLAFENALDAARLAAALDALGPAELALTMPRWEHESEFSLVETLKALGMPDAFEEGRADFSGMADLATAGGNLFISEVVHKAFIRVDEQGTEAAAATGVVVGITAMGPPPIEVTLDRPFIYVIYDLETEAVLFAGRVLNPAA